jgi:hypothetical protein
MREGIAKKMKVEKGKKLNERSTGTAGKSKNFSPKRGRRYKEKREVRKRNFFV